MYMYIHTELIYSNSQHPNVRPVDRGRRVPIWIYICVYIFLASLCMCTYILIWSTPINSTLHICIFGFPYEYTYIYIHISSQSMYMYIHTELIYPSQQHPTISVPVDRGGRGFARSHTGWRRLIGSPKLQIIFHKRATKYRSLLRKMTYKDKGSYESSPPCIYSDLVLVYLHTQLKYSNIQHPHVGPVDRGGGFSYGYIRICIYIRS